MELLDLPMDDFDDPVLEGEVGPTAVCLISVYSVVTPLLSFTDSFDTSVTVLIAGDLPDFELCGESSSSSKPPD